MSIEPRRFWETLSEAQKEQILTDLIGVVREVIEEQLRTCSAPSSKSEGGHLHPAVERPSGAHEYRESPNATRHARARAKARVG